MDIQPGSQPLFTTDIITCEKVQERLIYQRCILHRKWHEIQSDEFSTIPVGTLYKIMQTGKVPKKWWKVLGIKMVRPRIAISKVDMQKARLSITRNIEFSKVIKLTSLLNIYISKNLSQGDSHDQDA